MKDFHTILKWIDEQHTAMLDHVIEWSNINSYTFNLRGLEALSEKIRESFTVFDEEIEHVKMPPFNTIDHLGFWKKMSLFPVLILRKRPMAERQILFVNHMDTTYPPHESLQEAFLIEGRYLTGHGVSDAKGGIAILLTALEAFEKSDVAQKVGWKIVITSDEEIGSPCSAKILEKLAGECDVGYVFEPCWPDGQLVGSRTGYGSFVIAAYDQSSHGRSSAIKNRNAIDAMACCISRLHKLNGVRPGLSLNVGFIQGGASEDVPPEVAVMRFGVHFRDDSERSFAFGQIRKIIKQVTQEKHIKLKMSRVSIVPPKTMEDKTLRMYQHIQQCGADVGLRLQWIDSPAFCSGNRLQAMGLPTIDSMGVQGAKLMPDDEYMYIESLRERAKLTALSLMRWAGGEWYV